MDRDADVIEARYRVLDEHPPQEPFRIGRGWLVAVHLVVLGLCIPCVYLVASVARAEPDHDMGAVAAFLAATLWLVWPFTRWLSGLGEAVSGRQAEEAEQIASALRRAVRGRPRS